MSNQPKDPVRMRNAILIVGAATLLVGILSGPAISTLFTTRIGRLRMVLAVISGAFFAFGMQEIGGAVLRSSVEPWYARPGSALFITIMCALFVMGWIGLQEMGRELGKTISIDDIARFFTCIGWGLILITALNWVSYDD